MQIFLAGLAISLAISLAGCTYGGGKQVAPAEIAGFQEGIATPSDVIAQLGRPTTDMQDSVGGRTLGYARVASNVNGAAFVPIIGLFAGRTTGEYHAVIFMFGPDARLKSMRTIDSQSP